MLGAAGTASPYCAGLSSVISLLVRWPGGGRGRITGCPAASFAGVVELLCVHISHAVVVLWPEDRDRRRRCRSCRDRLRPHGRPHGRVLERAGPARRPPANEAE